MKYKAFISYRRSDALIVARWLRNRLLAFKPPKELVEQLPPSVRGEFDARTSFFLDTSYEVANEDFWTENIEPALRESQFLIVVSSPAALGAREDGSENWVAREIATFVEIHGRQESLGRILVVLAPGAPENAFPGRLDELGKRWDWADLRILSRYYWLRPGAAERLSDNFLKLAAALYDVPQDKVPALRQEEARRRGKVRLWAFGAAGAFVILIGAALGWAIVERGNAVRNYEAARSSVDRLVSVVATGLRDLRGVDVETIDRALMQVEGLVTDLANANASDPLLDRSKAAMLYEFAKTYQSAGAMAAARGKAEESSMIRRRLATTLPHLPEMRSELAESTDLIGDLLRGGGRYGDARDAFKEARRLRASLVDDLPEHGDWQKWLLGLSMSHVRLGDTDLDEENSRGASKDGAAPSPLVESAKRHYELSLKHSAQLYLGDKKHPKWRRELSWSFSKNGDFNAYRRHWALAASSYENALCLRRGLSQQFPTDTRLSSDVAWSLQKLGTAKLQNEEAAEAEARLLEMIYRRQKLVTDKPGDKPLVQEFLMGLGHLAEYERQSDRPNVVLALLTTITQESEKLKDPDGSIPRRLRVPDTDRLRSWATGRLAIDEVETIRTSPHGIMNRDIFQRAANFALVGYRPECLDRVDADLNALVAPEIPL